MTSPPTFQPSGLTGTAPGVVRQRARHRARATIPPLPLEPSGRILFVASTGGHLAELNRLASRFDAQDDSVWITFPTDQSRSLLDGRDVRYVPYVAPRDVLGVVKSFFHIRRLIRRERFDVVVSTGAAVAISAFLAARVSRTPGLYIESVARVRGASVTGQVIAALRLARLRTQHAAWSDGRWLLEQSVLADFEPVASDPAAPGPLRVLITLGTIRPYRFDALVDAVERSGVAGDRSVWQLGVTHRSGLPGRAVDQMGHQELLDEASSADVVITHAGVGTILELLELGIHPVVVPRSGRRGEHVDDHQYEIAQYLASLGVVTVVEAEALTAEHLYAAAAARTRASR